MAAASTASSTVAQPIAVPARHTRSCRSSLVGVALTAVNRVQDVCENDVYEAGEGSEEALDAALQQGRELDEAAYAKQVAPLLSY